MLKKIITKDEHTLVVGRTTEQGKIMIVLNNFTVNRDGKYVITTTSYLVKENAENTSPDTYVYQVEGFDFYKIKLIDEKVTTYGSQQIQYLFQAINKEILLTGDFTVQFTDLLNNALLKVVASENTFNVGGEDNWEFID